MVGLEHRAVLAVDECRRGEVVEVVDGAHQRQLGVLHAKRRGGRRGDAVLDVDDVEAAGHRGDEAGGEDVDRGENPFLEGAAGLRSREDGVGRLQRPEDAQALILQGQSSRLAAQVLQALDDFQRRVGGQRLVDGRHDPLAHLEQLRRRLLAHLVLPGPPLCSGISSRPGTPWVGSSSCFLRCGNGIPRVRGAHVFLSNHLIVFIIDDYSPRVA